MTLLIIIIQIIICIGILIMCKTEPDAPRAFKTPFVPLLDAFVCFIQMLALPADTWLRLIVWMAIGFVVYYGYWRKHSVARKLRREEL